jgi:hypothetical protein
MSQHHSQAPIQQTAGLPRGGRRDDDDLLFVLAETMQAPFRLTPLHSSGGHGRRKQTSELSVAHLLLPLALQALG